jgi:hypothetical protein
MKMFNLFSQIINQSEIDIPKGSPTSNTVTDGLQIVFGILAAIAVLIIAISALRIVISRGNSQDVSKARDAIIYAGIGLAVSLLGFIIVAFVLERL